MSRLTSARIHWWQDDRLKPRRCCRVSLFRARPARIHRAPWERRPRRSPIHSGPGPPERVIKQEKARSIGVVTEINIRPAMLEMAVSRAEIYTVHGAQFFIRRGTGMGVHAQHLRYPVHAFRCPVITRNLRRAVRIQSIRDTVTRNHATAPLMDAERKRTLFDAENVPAPETIERFPDFVSWPFPQADADNTADSRTVVSNRFSIWPQRDTGAFAFAKRGHFAQYFLGDIIFLPRVHRASPAPRIKSIPCLEATAFMARPISARIRCRCSSSAAFNLSSSEFLRRSSRSVASLSAWSDNAARSLSARTAAIAFFLRP